MGKVGRLIGFSKMFVHGIFFGPDEKGNGSGTGDSSNAGGTGEGNGNGSDNAGSGNGNQTPGNGNADQNSGGSDGGNTSTDDKGKSKPVTFTPEQQAEVNRIAAEAKRQAKDAAKREAETEEARKKGEFEKLYNDLNKTVESELKPKAALADDLSSIVNVNIDDEIKGWPESLKKQDPGKDSVKARLTWVQNSRDLAKDLGKLTQAPKGDMGGSASGSGGSGGNSAQTAVGMLKARRHIPGKKA